MTRLPDLHDQLVAAAVRQEAPRVGVGVGVRVPARRRMPAARVLVLALLAALALAAIGAAATGLLGSGEDVAPRSGKAPTPKTGYGVATGAVAAPIVVEDPGGERLDWGLRTFTTTRGYACLQLGRVQDRKLGLIGRDGAFEDDGLFHALGPQVLDRGNCVPLDAGGHGFLAVRNAEMPGAGMMSCLPPSMVQAFGGRVPPKMKACSASGIRTVDYGLLGPHAKSITYKLPGGGTRTVAVAAGTGAFLVVSPRQAVRQTSGPSGRGGRMTGGDDHLMSQTPESRTIVSVAYDDGTVCRVRHRLGPYGSCPAKGFAPVRARRPSRAAVAARVTARIARNAEGSFTLHVAFRARAAASTRLGGYNVTIRPPAGCAFGVQGHQIARDVTAGTRVGAAIKLDRRMCRGWYAIDVDYRVPRRFSLVGAGLAYPGTPVGSTSAELVK
jgi:hypothetical protein